MDEIEKINILMKEYETLKKEILQRISNRFTFISLVGAVGTYTLFNAKTINLFQALSLLTALIFLFGVWMQLGLVIKRCSKRIAEIETIVNAKAGEELLKWEKDQLGSQVFHVFHN